MLPLPALHWPCRRRAARLRSTKSSALRAGRVAGGNHFNDLHVYVGVSSGSFIAAGLANGIKPIEMCRMFIESDGGPDEPFDPALLMRPAFGEYLRRAGSLLPLLLTSTREYLSNPIGQGFFASFQRLSHALPAGIFDSAGIGDFLERLFTQPGPTYGFRRLRHKLFIVATELDTAATAWHSGHPAWTMCRSPKRCWQRCAARAVSAGAHRRAP